MRAMAFSAADLGLSPRAPGHPDVAGVVVDIPSDDGFATLVSLTDGATSLYTSTGGGVIGAGEHASVAEATSALLAEAQARLSELAIGDEDAHPLPNHVRFFVLGDDGRRSFDVPLEEFWTPNAGHWAAVVAAAQNVLTELRQIRRD